MLALIGCLAAIAGLNPAPTPQPAKDARYAKISLDGRVIGAWQGPWGCVLDRHTGLVWEVKSYAEDLHDQQCSFSWFDGRIGAEDGGSCFVEGGGSDTEDLVQYANAQRRCGVAGWRLPSEQELKTLLIETPMPGDLLIARDYFPYAQRGVYWTSDAEEAVPTRYRNSGKGAVLIDFKDGRRRVLPYRDAAFARLVADDESGSWSEAGVVR